MASDMMYPSVPFVTLTGPPAPPLAPNSALAIGDQTTDQTSLVLTAGAWPHNPAILDLAETEKGSACLDPPLAGYFPASCSSIGVAGVEDW
jgi:hypothetical protein